MDLFKWTQQPSAQDPSHTMKETIEIIVQHQPTKKNTVIYPCMIFIYAKISDKVEVLGIDSKSNFNPWYFL